VRAKSTTFKENFNHLDGIFELVSLRSSWSFLWSLCWCFRPVFDHKTSKISTKTQLMLRMMYYVLTEASFFRSFYVLGIKMCIFGREFLKVLRCQTRRNILKKPPRLNWPIRKQHDVILILLERMASLRATAASRAQLSFFIILDYYYYYYY
jgi:hypothetical protein